MAGMEGPWADPSDFRQLSDTRPQDPLWDGAPCGSGPLSSQSEGAELRPLGTGLFASPSCYEVNLRGCLLQALFVNFSRPPGSQEEENFVCRLGEIQVVDANSLLTPLPQVQAVTVSQVRWQPAASEGESGPAGLRLSCTLHWAYLLPHVRCFRIHCCRGSGGDSPCRGPSEPEKPTLLGLAFVNRYRIVDLAVAPAEPGRDGRVEFLVEPIPKEGFLVPRAEWGRAAMLYSTPRT